MSLYNRVKDAVMAVPSIAIPVSEIETTEGFSLAEMQQLGLSKADLKKLESKGLAGRGYRPRPKNSGYEVRFFLIDHGKRSIDG